MDRAAILKLLSSTRNMPHHYNCCVPGCQNNFRNAPTLHYYRIPKDKDLRKTYKVILKNETLKVESENTRVCCEHFEGGEKCRSHLPSVFPWTKDKKQRRELKRHAVETFREPKSKRKEEECYSTAPACLDKDADGLVTDVPLTPEVTNIDQKAQYDTQGCQTDLTRQWIDNLMKELENLRKENKELKEKGEQSIREIKHLDTQMSMNIKKTAVFNIEKYKDNPDDIAFYTGFPDYEAFMLCYNIVKEAAKNISYNHERIYCDLEKKNQPGRPRSLTTFQEFTLVMIRLRLGLFERDLAHRFNVSIMTIS